MRKVLACVIGLGHVASADPPRVPAPADYQPAEEIGDHRAVGGAVAEIMFGFGIGQALEGRWHESGWVFTVTDLVSGFAFTAGIMAATLSTGPSRCHTPDCNTHFDNPMFIAGASGLALSRIAGALDALLSPHFHDQRIRDARARLFLAPDRDGALGGVALRF